LRNGLTAAGAPPAKTGEWALRVEGLTKSYGAKPVLTGVSFAVRYGEIFGLLGPNGAGKTTTLEIIEGLRELDGGRVEVLGFDRTARNVDAIRERLGVSLQSTEYWEDLSLRELVRLFGSFYPRAVDADTLAARFEMQEVADVRIRNLSGGMKQRVTLALALVNDPEILLLDEPSAGLDPQLRRRLWETLLELKESGKTIILTTHYMEEAAYLCDRVAILTGGRIVSCDSPAASARALEESVSMSFGTQVDVEIEALAGQAWCLRAERTSDGRFRLDVPELVEGLRGLLHWSEDAGVPIQDLRCQSASLEDAYLHHVFNGAGAPETVGARSAGRDLP
jgi:ABC-2 type transport system ATP-binding protein